MLESNKLYLGDCIEVMKGFPDNCIDSIITDPPYGLGFMGKEWDKLNIIGRDRSKAIQRTSFGKIMDSNYETPRIIRSKRKKCLNCGGYSGGPFKNCTCENPQWEIDKYPKAMQNFHYQWASECLRVLKPGGHLLSFGGTRTYHRMVCGIEDAGFEIRDCIQWLYGSGFPKNLDISKEFDKKECHKQLTEKLGRKPTKDEFKKAWEKFREIIGKQNYTIPKADNTIQANSYGLSGGSLKNGTKAERISSNITVPVIPEAKQWDGWGTALKPANEPIVLARKPISEKNIAENVLRWETGGINVDGCKIGNEELSYTSNMSRMQKWSKEQGARKYKNGFKSGDLSQTVKGRWPANVIFDEEAAELLNEQSGNLHPGITATDKAKSIYGSSGNQKRIQVQSYKDKGGASRFFYVAKASKSERNAGLEGFEKKVGGGMKGTEDQTLLTGSGNIRNNLLKNNHPTVKPIKLMRYLVRLITPPGGICLDPFIGSGTTAIACIQEGFNYIGIEKKKEYFDIAEKRIFHYKQQLKLF